MKRKSHRVVNGLLSARRLDCRPSCIPIGRPRGAKAAGIRYQHTVERALLGAFPRSGIDVGPWFEYSDVNGRGYCQPDFLIYNPSQDEYVICECKLSDWLGAEAQMRELYIPVAERALGTKVNCLVILHNLAPGIAEYRVFGDFRDALWEARLNSPPIWHYLGRGPVSAAGRHASPHFARPMPPSIAP